mgnify:FL=1
MSKQNNISVLTNDINSLNKAIEKTTFDIEKNRRYLISLKNTVNGKKEELERLKQKKEIEFTDHAMVRYFERILLADTELIKNNILSPQTVENIYKLGGTCEFSTNGMRIKVKNYAVVTIIKE